MKFAAIVIATLSLATAGAAAAQDQASDQVFMKANRCKGLAIGLGADASAVKTFIRAQSRSRADMIIYRGQALAGDAQREAADPAKKEKLSAEFAADCSAFSGGSSSVAARGTAAISTVR